MSTAPVAFVFVVVTFALTVTLVVALVVGLARRGKTLEALASLVIPPLGVVFGYRAGLRKRSIAAAAAFGAYCIARVTLG
jgi:hypothetical protein